jgi:GntR family transcriptional regulator
LPVGLLTIDCGYAHRLFLTGRPGTGRTGLHAEYYPAAFAEAVPDILSTAPGQQTPLHEGDDVRVHPGTGNDLLSQIADRLGRRVTSGRDGMHAREATEREASLLGCKIGTPILAGAHEWSDDQGLIMYSEWCLPNGHVIGYEYAVE